MPLDLTAALALAIEVAREAGAMLRAERRRDGGPAGDVDHADIDLEVERWIRGRLTAETSYRYLGEETGEVEGDPTAPLWIVDPNDGTAAYLRGFRGSATSIAVVHEGRPVLGVVLAYAYPDDDGELFAWAEGAGPLTRDGAPVLAGTFAGGVVYVSQDADRNPQANARCSAPARFFPLASIAHRLARAAAGLAAGGFDTKVAGVSLSHCVSWDVAAGHALLLGAGGELFDERGEPIRYDTQGRARCARCFGGAKAFARELAGRAWGEVRERPSISAPASGPTGPSSAPMSGRPTLTGDPRFPRVRPSLSRAVHDAARLSRAQGCMLGQLSGDALGSLVEFERPEAIARRFPGGVRALQDGGTFETIAGQPTDDSELALLLSRTLVRDRRFDASAVRDAYLHWKATGPFDIGLTIAAALEGKPKADSQANGALMRVSPLGIFSAGRAEQGAEWARADAALTHPHPVCADASAAYVTAIATLIDGGDARAAHAAAMAASKEPAVREALGSAAAAMPGDFVTQAGWVLIALRCAFHQLLRARPSATAFEDALADVVGRGGDTDTNAAITGALLGAAMGLRAIPARWRTSVLSCRPIDEVGARHPRPIELWPVDALDIAEALLAIR